MLYSGEFLEYGIHDEFFLPLSMFKRSRIGNLRFEKGRVFFEDMLFYSTFLLQDLKCMYLPDIRFYGYRKNENSASNKVSVKQLADSFSMCTRFHELAQQAQIIAGQAQILQASDKKKELEAPAMETSATEEESKKVSFFRKLFGRG